MFPSEILEGLEGVKMGRKVRSLHRPDRLVSTNHQASLFSRFKINPLDPDPVFTLSKEYHIAEECDHNGNGWPLWQRYLGSGLWREDT
jgi:hypothetical protein